MTRSDRLRRATGFDNVPLDLALTVGGAILSYGLVLANPGHRASAEPLGTAFFVLTLLGAFAGITLLLILPGYAFAAAIFPNRRPGPISIDHGDPALSAVERLALSGGLGIVIAAFIGLVIAWTSLEYSGASAGLLVTLLVTLSGLVGTLRGHVSLIEYRPSTLRRLVRGPKSSRSNFSRDRAASVLLSVIIILALGSLSVALVMPNPGESFTNFSVLVETDDGVEAAAAYPGTITQYESASFQLVIQNHESGPAAYTIIVQEERVNRGADGMEILAANELIRMSVDVRSDATTERRIAVAPTMTGTDLRLGFYLDRGDGPTEPSPATAYRFLYILIDVEAANGNSGSG